MSVRALVPVAKDGQRLTGPAKIATRAWLVPWSRPGDAANAEADGNAGATTAKLNTRRTEQRAQHLL